MTTRPISFFMGNGVHESESILDSIANKGSLGWYVKFGCVGQRGTLGLRGMPSIASRLPPFRTAGESPFQFVLVGFRPFQFALVGFPGGLGQEAQEVLARSVAVAAHSYLGSRPSRSVPR